MPSHIAPGRAEIYATDDERTMSDEEAQAFGELPRTTPEARADVVAAHPAG
ncbi:hypothetical protein [Salinarimonas rosea]|uniref:hypothetical protein n=1 Tax=Salinarimonas rosea TaxID=552063 RepID=UPI0004229751|nr:hypothetical protein [Salinarimonas rosea]